VRRAARLAAALALCATALGPALPAAAQPEPLPDSVRVDLRSMSPFLRPGDGEHLVVRARAVSQAAAPLRRLRMSLRFGEALRGRSDIASGQPLARQGARVADSVLGDGELAPSGTADADFDVPVEELPFRNTRRQAVYPLRIEIRARGVVVGAADTYVMWWPVEGAPRLRVAWVWPLVERSHRLLGDDFHDDDLADSVEDGRLVTLLRVGGASRIPLTWAVDPEVLDALRRMADGYTVRGQEGRRGGNARAFLDRVKGLRNAAVLPLPYADPDLSAGPEAVGKAVVAGREILRRELGTPGDERLAWPPGATLDPGAQSLLALHGAQGLVLPEEALPLTESLYYTPTAPTALDTGVLRTTALVVDRQLAQAVGGNGADARLAVQRFLADSAMVALERPNDVRDVVLAPPRRWDPRAEYAQQLLEQTRQAPWLEPVTLADVLDDEKSTAPRVLTAPGARVLPAEQTRRVAEARSAVTRLTAVLTDTQRAAALFDDLDDALLRAVSSQWGADPGNARRLPDAVVAAVAAQLGKVRIVPGGVVTMTGRSGRIPLTIQNDLGQTVRVRVRLDSKDRLALENDAAWRRGNEVAVPPGGSTFVIEGKATTGGLFPVKVELLDRDGRPIGDAYDLRVRSTAWGVVALGVTGVAFGLLLVASATRLLRRRRAAPATA
jgi:hypothetical protein